MATKRWKGGALAVAQVDTVTIALTWADNDTITLTINGKDLVLTSIGSTNTDDIASMLAASINAGSSSGGVLFTETRNIGGQEIPEFRELIAESVGSVVTITGNRPGIPFVISSTQATAGSGTATHATATQATGPNHFDDPDNWVGNLLPVSGDVTRFDMGATAVSYGLQYMRDNSLDFTFQRMADYTAMIGLPEVNATGYYEYRNRYLQMYDATNIALVEFLEGGNLAGGGSTNLDFDGQSCSSLKALFVSGAFSSDLLEVTGGTFQNVTVGRGRVVLEPLRGSAATRMKISGQVRVGQPGFPLSDTDVTIAESFERDTGPGSIVLNSGRLGIESATVTTNNITIGDGELEIRGPGSHGTIIIQGGIFYPTGTGQIAGVQVWSGGSLSIGRSAQAIQLGANIVAYGGSTIDLAGQDFDLVPTGCFLHQVNLTE